MRGRLRLLFAVGAGLTAGLASGLLGVGGGVVMVPILVALGGFKQHKAHATSLAAIVPIASVGGFSYLVGDGVDCGMAGLLVIGGLVGAPIGARLMGRSKEGTLKVLFGVLMLVVGIRLLLP